MLTWAVRYMHVKWRSNPVNKLRRKRKKTTKKRENMIKLKRLKAITPSEIDSFAPSCMETVRPYSIPHVETYSNLPYFPPSWPICACQHAQYLCEVFLTCLIFFIWSLLWETWCMRKLSWLIAPRRQSSFVWAKGRTQRSISKADRAASRAWFLWQQRRRMRPLRQFLEWQTKRE